MKVNSVVRLKGKKLMARIEIKYADIEGGVRLDRRLGGFYSWNASDLEIVPKRERKKWAPEDRFVDHS